MCTPRNGQEQNPNYATDEKKNNEAKDAFFTKDIGDGCHGEVFTLTGVFYSPLLVSSYSKDFGF
jgi:hypothetical protein